MSLVSTCVQADDKKIYKNPILSGEDFFICFDDDDPPELVIKTLNRSDTELHQRAIDILKNINLNTTISSKPQKSGRLFESNLTFIDAYSIFITINSPIPSNSITKHDGIYDGQSECVLYRWPEKLTPVQPSNEGQRYWPSQKPKWTPKHIIKKIPKPITNTPTPKDIIFIPTTSGNKIAAIIKSHDNNGYTLLIYNQQSHQFDKEVFTTDLSTPIE